MIEKCNMKLSAEDVKMHLARLSAAVPLYDKAHGVDTTDSVPAIRAHIAALEAERDTALASATRGWEVADAFHVQKAVASFTPSGQVAEAVEQLRATIDHAWAQNDALNADDHAFLSLLATKAQDYDAMKAALKKANERLGAISCAYCDWRSKHNGTLADAKAKLVSHVAVCAKHPMRALEAERDAAVADNAVRTERLNESLGGLRVAVDSGDMPMGDGAVTEITNYLDDMAAILAEPAPSTALLAEHAKALVRARNEWREEAARHCDKMDYPGTAAAIRARKEPEE